MAAVALQAVRPILIRALGTSPVVWVPEPAVATAPARDSVAPSPEAAALLQVIACLEAGDHDSSADG